jgi:hypothetical protein
VLQLDAQCFLVEHAAPHAGVQAVEDVFTELALRRNAGAHT